ncbi:MAG: acetamidase/formamidase family protein [Thermomicrobiales bacterium]
MARHAFTPERYYTTMGSYPSALRIAPGDTVVTTTVDSLGHDASGKPVTPGFNPMIGPFFVDGAEPGDTLVVHLVRLVPNRPTGVSTATLAPNVVDPEFVRHLPEHPLMEWVVDLTRDQASPRIPISGLEALRLPLHPMLGCLGVAPAGGQVLPTVTSAEHGGNMDYRGFRAGATAYFPVFAPGALLFLGDGHATQGDGEISGAGIEVPFDVEFTVDVRKGHPIGWPRGEDEDSIFTIGNARPLDQALRHATTEMVHWLERDWNLDIVAASTLLGQCVEYDIGNVFNPAYTMICKLPKRMLQQVTART